MGFNSVFCVTQFALLANIISACSVWDSSCLTPIAQTHLRQIMRSGPMDPMELKPVSLDDGKLKFTWGDISIVGLRDNIVETVQFNTVNRSFRLRSRVPVLSMSGNYNSTGHVEDVPFFGKGKILAVHHFFVNDLIIKYNVSSGKDGKKYLDLESYTYWFETPNSVTNFVGLNADSPLKARQAQEHSITRSQKLWQQFGRNYFDPMNDKIFDALKKFFRGTSTDELLLSDE